MASLQFEIRSLCSCLKPLRLMMNCRKTSLRQEHTMPEDIKKISEEASPSIKDMAQYYYHFAAEQVDDHLEKSLESNPEIKAEDRESRVNEIISLIGQPPNCFEVTFPLRKQDGKCELITGYRSQHIRHRMPATGGIRYEMNISPDDIRGLAYLTTFQCACVNVPFGGAFGGVCIDQKQYSVPELQTITEQYAMQLLKHNMIGPTIDIPAPDVNTSAREMGWIYDLYSKTSGYKDINALAVATGKSEFTGGIAGSVEAAGRGVFYAGDSFIQDKDWMDFIGAKTGWEDKTAIVQGFGNLGSYAAKFLHEAGAKIIGIMEKDVSLQNPEGINITELFDHFRVNKTIKGFPNAEETSDNLLCAKCDIFLPCATESVITKENVDKVEAKLILEGATGAITPAAYAILLEKDVLVVPDIYCNAGSVAVSYFEYLKNICHVSHENASSNRMNALLKEVFDSINKSFECSENVPKVEPNEFLQSMQTRTEADIVAAGLCNIMESTGQTIKEIAHEFVLCNDLRTAAYINSIQKIFRNYV